MEEKFDFERNCRRFSDASGYGRWSGLPRSVRRDIEQAFHSMFGNDRFFLDDLIFRARNSDKCDDRQCEGDDCFEGSLDQNEADWEAEYACDEEYAEDDEDEREAPGLFEDEDEEDEW